MSGSKVVPAVLAVVLAITACLGDFHLSASNLNVAPIPARPGDVVTISFSLSILPLQPHTIKVIIDDQEYLRVSSSEQPSSPFVMTLGDAADLIAEFGTGTHSMYVEVVAEEENESARTQPVGFELQAATP